MSDEKTFLAWADPHFGFEMRFVDDDIRYRCTRQMEQLVGYPFPSHVGGVVGKPAAVILCGDFVDGGGDGRQVDLFLHCMGRFKLPTFETLGNHDISCPRAVEYFVRRYGAKYHRFDAGGIRFLSLYKPHGILDRIPPLDDEQLAWVAREVASAPAAAPIVIFGHGQPEELPNENDFEAAIAPARRVLFLSGHTHLQWGEEGIATYTWRGRPGVIVGHCRDHPIDPLHGRTFAVVRAAGDELTVAAWRWDLQQWSCMVPGAKDDCLLWDWGRGGPVGGERNG